MQDQIRAQLQSNTLLEREAALRKISEKYQGEAKKWAEEAAAMQREATASLEKYSQSDQESAQAEAKLAIENRFSQRRIALDKDFTDKSSAEYQARLADLENTKQQELQITEKSVSDRLAAEADYTSGFRRGTLNWIDSARDANSQMASYAGTLFDSMTDSIATFATTGKLSFRSFTTSVLSDLAKIAARVALSSALQSIVGTAGSLFTGSTSSAGNAGTALSAGSNTNLSFNAKGGVYDSPSLSAYSGQVYNSPQVFAFAKGAGVFGEAGPEAIMPLTRSADGSLGVRAVSGGSTSQGGSTYIQVDAPVTIVQGESSSDASSTGTANAASQIKSIVQNTISERLRKEIAPGGLLYSGR